MSAATCQRRTSRFRACGGVLDLQVIDGRLVERCPLCVRRERGICRDCPRPVYGTVGKALRCESCAKAARQEAFRRYESEPENRKRRNAANRKRWRTSAERRRKKRENRRAWAKANPDREKRHRRRYHLKRTPGYVAGYQRHNARPERQEAKRAQAKRRYYELHPVRPDPRCRGCDAPIAWTPGHGRPCLTCDACCTPAELRRRQRQRAARTIEVAA